MRSVNDSAIRVHGLDELIKKYDRAPEVLHSHLVIALGSSGLIIEKNVKAGTPVKTRNLRGSIVLQTTPLEAAKGLKVTVGTPVIYGEPVEYGQKPHEISAKNAPFLVFQINGNWVRVKTVNHPGSDGAFMFRDGLEASRGRVMDLFQKAIDDTRKELEI